MYFHEFIYKSYSALLILVFFLYEMNKKWLLLCFSFPILYRTFGGKLLCHLWLAFSKQLWSRASFSFWVFICCFASVLSKELLMAVNSRLRFPMLLPQSWTLLFVPSQFLQTELFGQAELVDLAGNILLKVLIQVKNGI